MSIVNIIKEPEYYYPAGMAEQDGLMTYQESQKLSSIPTPSNIVTKSSTVGLLKNDGTVDTTSYATAVSVSAITDGQSIDSFSDVETALAGKADTSDLPGVATSQEVGLVKPDGTTVTVDANGVLTAVGGGSTPYDGRKTRYTISSSNWSSSPNSDGYYTYSLTLTNPLTTSTSPNVYIAGASDSIQPTATESTMFSYVKRCNLSSSTTLVLYASTKPTSTFYVFVGAEGGTSGSYSTSETLTGETWIDGRPIYRKVVDFGALPNNDQKSVEYTVGTNSILRIDAIAYNRSNLEYSAITLPYINMTNNRYININHYTRWINITTNYDASNYNAYVTVYYVKEP